jgi:hypothetical protein
VANPELIAHEVARVVRPGGWCCARTPNRQGYIAVAARLLPNSFHRRAIQRLQPGRQDKDVFPTRYRLNTPEDIARHFGGSFADYSFPFWANLDYGSQFKAARFADRVFRILPDHFAPMFYVFLKRLA